MEQTAAIWVIGGDLRQAKLASLLSRDGYDVHTFALEGAPECSGVTQEDALCRVSRADCAILPLPLSSDGESLNAPLSHRRYGIPEILDALVSCRIVCAGRVDARSEAHARERGITLHDYFCREELMIANAVPTAEGAIQIAMEELPVTIHGSRVLIAGFGRIGRVLAPRLLSLGAKTTVAARKYADFAWAQSIGCRTISIERLKEEPLQFDLIVNTVPHHILNREELLRLPQGCLIIDLASNPGGLDFNAAAQLGIKVVWALSLPGRVAPATSGEIIRDTIYHIFQEMGV